MKKNYDKIKKSGLFLDKPRVFFGLLSFLEGQDIWQTQVFPSHVQPHFQFPRNPFSPGNKHQKPWALCTFVHQNAWHILAQPKIRGTFPPRQGVLKPSRSKVSAFVTEVAQEKHAKWPIGSMYIYIYIQILCVCIYIYIDPNKCGRYIDLFLYVPDCPSLFREGTGSQQNKTVK